MKLLGLIGGIAPESTIDYYRRLVAACRERAGYPPIVVNSIDLTKLLALAANDRPALAAWLIEEVERVARAGAELGAFASNTPHLVFDEVQRAASIPLVSIVDCARDAAVARRLRRVALLGTRFTMTGTFYPAVFAGAGIALVTPSAEEQTWVHDTYMTDLVAGRFEVATQRRFLRLVEELRERERIDGVILAGTELPLLLRDATVAGVEMLDTTALHVAALVERMV
ncbi:MAG TPA: amino acid racemase [Thermoanaerobaculia bacterium]